MKAAVVTLVLTLFTAVFAQASLDSVGVFHRPEKVVVLINEDYRSSRLSQLMDALGLGDSARVISQDGSVKMDCGRNAQAATCTFRFFPSDLVNIGDKNVEALVSVQDLQISSAQNYDMTFESSMQDRFVVQISEGKMHFFANKRGAGK